MNARIRHRIGLRHFDELQISYAESTTFLAFSEMKNVLYQFYLSLKTKNVQEHYVHSDVVILHKWFIQICKQFRLI